MSNILIIGSSNTDLVVKTARFPQPGETILGGDFFMFPGGKGANQAVAAARLGGQIKFISKLGNDIFGNQSRNGFIQEGIALDYIFTDEHTSSGVALITVNQAGENEIVVIPGANGTLSPTEIEQAHLAFESAEIVLLQLEIPLPTVEFAIQKSYQLGKKVILNPAPAQMIDPKLYPLLYLITPNETEAQLLTGILVKDIDSAEKAAQILLEKGTQNIIITLGAQGAFFKNKEQQFLITPLQVQAIDSTAAGDVFNGALTVALAKGLRWQEAIAWASKAAAISVTRMGAQASAPYLYELENQAF